jgi:hypothetical protein
MFSNLFSNTSKEYVWQLPLEKNSPTLAAALTVSGLVAAYTTVKE